MHRTTTAIADSLIEELVAPRWREVRQVGATTFAVRTGVGGQMKLFVCIFSDARLLPHFLSHYTRFGVSEFHIAAPPRLAEEVLGMSGNHSVALYSGFDVDESVTGGTAAVSAMRDAAQRDG